MLVYGSCSAMPTACANYHYHHHESATVMLTARRHVVVFGAYGLMHAGPW